MKPAEMIEEAERLLARAEDGFRDTLKGDNTRRRGPLNAQRWRAARMRGQVAQYFSQAGQDRVIDRLLGEKEGGVFADIGGYDGFTGSNTLFFEMFRGWSGILVEPAPAMFRAASRVRRCPCLQTAIGPEGEAEFMTVTRGYLQMSGFIDSYDSDMLARVRGNPVHEEEVTRIARRPLEAVLDEAGLSRIDYLSLDVEGGERAILENFPFERFDIAVWSIENNGDDPEIPRLMKAAGYRLTEFVGEDDIFTRG